MHIGKGRALKQIILRGRVSIVLSGTGQILLTGNSKAETQIQSSLLPPIYPDQFNPFSMQYRMLSLIRHDKR